VALENQKEEDPMTRRFQHRFGFRLVAAVVLALVLAPALASAQVVVKLNDVVNFRFGLQLQTWADWQQDPNSQGYSQNFYIRRIRAIILATVAPRVTIFYQTDNPRYGNAGVASTAAKVINTGFLTQDAYIQWAFAGDMAMLQGGLFLVPASRNALTSTVSFLPIDIGQWELQGNALEQGNAGRDYGFGLAGYLLGDHLGYRMGVFDGLRRNGTAQTAPIGTSAGSRNSFRYAVRVNYDFCDTEKGYTYVGTNNGAKKIIAIGGWYDTQDSYEAYGFDTIVDWPIAGNAIKAEADYKHYTSGTSKQFGPPPVANALSPQKALYMDLGFYIAAAHLQPFVKWENLDLVSQALEPANNQRNFGGGFNYYIFGQNFKISALYQKNLRNRLASTAAIKNTNRFILQMQAVYF